MEGRDECWFQGECPYRMLLETPGLEKLVAASIAGIRKDEHTDPKTKATTVEFHPDRDSIVFAWRLHRIEKASRRRRSMDWFRRAAEAAEQGYTGNFLEATEGAEAVAEENRLAWEEEAKRQIAAFEERKRLREAKRKG